MPYWCFLAKFCGSSVCRHDVNNRCHENLYCSALSAFLLRLNLPTKYCYYSPQHWLSTKMMKTEKTRPAQRREERGGLKREEIRVRNKTYTVVHFSYNFSFSQSKKTDGFPASCRLISDDKRVLTETWLDDTLISDQELSGNEFGVPVRLDREREREIT